MIIYRYATHNTPIQVYNALTGDNKIRIKIGLNAGYESGKGYIHDTAWQEYENGNKDRPSPKLEYLIMERAHHTEIILAFYYCVLTQYNETVISRSEKRRKLIERVLRKKLTDFVRIPEVII